jgi:hypothetical protein
MENPLLAFIVRTSDGKTARYSVYRMSTGVEVVGPNLEKIELRGGSETLEDVRAEIARLHGVSVDSVKEIPG